MTGAAEPGTMGRAAPPGLPPKTWLAGMAVTAVGVETMAVEEREEELEEEEAAMSAILSLGRSE